MKDRLFEIWLALRCGPANSEFQRLLDQYGSAYDLFRADESELEQLPISPRLRAALADKSLQDASRIAEYCRTNRVGLLFWSDEAYPASLRPLRDPPLLLYYRGHLPDLGRRLCISVVGTRSMSEYGKRMAYKIGYELAAAGTVVVSGMALGNDSVAAAGAIAAGGETVAFLGSGIDIVYPREHTKLFEAILEHGAVMTEFAPGTPPEGKNFPIRNRLISGLSQGTVVVEGDLKSGALITARTAILQGRDIYAFPGNVGELNAAGTNRLISDGAAMARSARDVLENYTFLYRDAVDMMRLEQAESRSDLDIATLDRLGVCTRTYAPEKSTHKDAAPKQEARAEKAPVRPSHVPCKSEKPTDKRTPAPQKTETAKPLRSSRDTQAPKAVAPDAPNRPSPIGDASGRVLDALTPTQRGIFEALPFDHAVPIDYLTREGFSIGDVMAAMTVLEIKGLTVTLPGGLYMRK